jgi:RNA polymerase I-specific transcription initiation factor RRN6
MALPEAGPAKASITSMIKAEMSDLSAHRSSSLLAIGRAADIDHMTGTRSIQIMGMVHGEAGNLLRLVKPRIEGLKWDSQHDTKLRSVNPIAGEECYWAGSGGAIQQITFGADGDGSTSWLAVLKEESITILRPVYRRVQTPSLTSIDVNGKVPPSRLNPNPILSLNTEQTSAKSYTDVSFNPWYIRQFAVMDQQGYWSVWDVEGQKRKRTTFKARPGRSGHIQDDLPPGQGYASQDSLDGWGRVLWAGSVSTIIVCNRRSFSVFDLKAAPKRLHSPEIVHPNSIDWILDIKRSPVNLNQIFVLTTKQVFWLEIAEADENRDKQFGCVGAKILLSCQHFRNQEDETAKLELLGEMDGTVISVETKRPDTEF